MRMIKTDLPGIEERFVAKVAKSDGCWEWTASRDKLGYGRFHTHTEHGRSIKALAHRWSYSRWIGEIPMGLEIDHLCRNRACVRPDHLEAVSHQENVSRGETGQHYPLKAYCWRGHAYDELNTYVGPTGSRGCRACNRLKARLLRARLAGASCDD